MTLPNPQPKVMPYLTIIPGRKPVQKLHVNVGHAKNAINGRIHAWGIGADSDMELHEFVDGQWKLLFSVKTGDKEPPWRVEELRKQREKREKADREFARKQTAEAVKVAQANAKHYYENVIGEPRAGDEDYENIIDGYIEGFLRGIHYNGG